MSSNRSKPTDRGAASPKPSRKVALDEVLRTLQDLVQHDLDVDSLPSRKAGPPPAPDVAPPTTAAETAPASEHAATDKSATIPLADTIILETPPALPDKPAPAADTIAYTPTTSDSAPPSPAKPKFGRRAKDRGVQQELPYLDTPAAAAVEMPAPLPQAAESPDFDLPPLDMQAVDWSAPPAEPATTRDAELSIVEDDLPSLPESPEPAIAAPPPAPAATSPTVADDSVHDIPVLEDAVDFHHEPPPDTHPTDSAPASRALPAAGAARRLAIQVAARLNVMLRKEGKPVLSSELIARLAHELEEALAKGGANMENSPSEKH